MLLLPIVRNDGFEMLSSIMYGISVTDILPNVFMHPIQHVFGDYIEQDDNVPLSF